MNRHSGLFPLALLSGMMALTVAAPVADVRGQAAPLAPVAPAAPAGSLDALKGSSSVASAGPQIAAAINAQVARLTSGDPAASAAARDTLIDAVSPGRVNPTPTFLNAFAGALNTGIAPALKHESDMIRLNAAIVVARVAERTDDAALQGATLALLNDKSPFVVLWGLKAARAVIPAVLRNPAIKPDPLFSALVKAAGTHSVGAIGGAIAVEAYEALMLDIFEPARPKPGDRELRAVIPVMQQLLQQRAQLYVKTMPPEPIAENRATLFIVNARVWALHNTKQKLASVQVMSDLAGLAAQRAALAAPADKENLALMIKGVVGAIAVVPEAQSVQDGLAAAVKLAPGAAPEQIQEAVNAVVPALKKVPAFAQVTPPPAIAADAPAAAAGGAGGASTRPTSAPTTAATVPATAAAIGQ